MTRTVKRLTLWISTVGRPIELFIVTVLTMVNLLTILVPHPTTAHRATGFRENKMATKYELAVARAEEAEKALDQAQESAAEHRAHAAKLEKELASAKSTSDSWYKQLTEAKNEVDQVHHLMDALPNAPARKGAANEYGSAPQFALMTRLAAWMAVRA